MEEMKLILGLVASVAASLTAVLTLVYELVKYIRKAAEERNWPKMVKLVADFMAEAETKLVDGADRKEWVLAMAKVAAEEIGYNVDMNAVSQLIDDLCEMSKLVNTQIQIHSAEEDAGDQ